MDTQTTSPGRLFTQEEVDVYLPLCFKYAASEFGPDDCIPLERLRLYRKAGVHLYQPYGDFSGSEPKVLGLAHCLLTSEAEMEELRQHRKLETELEPYREGQGKAVFWVSGVVSDIPGVAAKCIAGVLDLVDHSPFRKYIGKIALISTGPQGYLMSDAFGLKPDGFEYRDGWPFMERTITPDEIAAIGKALPGIWTMTKVRDVMKYGAETWGRNWRRQTSVRVDKDKRP